MKDRDIQRPQDNIDDKKTFSREERIQKVQMSYGDNAASYIQSPIIDRGFLDTIAARAKAFTHADNPVSISIDHENVIDLGADDVNDSLTAAAIDLANSRPLTDLLSQRLRYEVNRDTASAAFITRKAFNSKMSQNTGAPVISYREFVLVSSSGGQKLNSLKTQSKYLVHVLDKSDLYTQYDNVISIPNATTIADEISKLEKHVPNQSKRITGFYNKLAIQDNGQWKNAKYDTVKSMTNGEARIKARTSTRAQSMFEPDEYHVIHIQSKEPTSDVNIPPSAMKRPRVASIGGSERVQIYQPSIGPDLRTDGGRAGTGDTSGDDSGGTITGSGNSGSGTGGGTILFGPPWNTLAGFTCSGFSTPGDCKTCCGAYFGAAVATLGALALQCHVSCNILIPCHIACGVVEAALLATFGWYLADCNQNCEHEYWRAP